MHNYCEKNQKNSLNNSVYLDCEDLKENIRKSEELLKELEKYN